MVLFVISASFYKSLRKKVMVQLVVHKKTKPPPTPVPSFIPWGMHAVLYLISVPHLLPGPPNTTKYLFIHPLLSPAQLDPAHHSQGAWHPSVSDPREADLNPI